jgi:hypothetical protein
VQAVLGILLALFLGFITGGLLDAFALLAADLLQGPQSPAD